MKVEQNWIFNERITCFVSRLNFSLGNEVISHYVYPGENFDWIHHAQKALSSKGANSVVDGQLFLRRLSQMR